MRITATPIALAAFCLGMITLPAAAADRNTQTAPTSQIALQPVAASADSEEAAAPNCLLPGQLRNFGGLTLLTPRRPVTLSASECVTRGGEPITGTAIQ